MRSLITNQAIVQPIATRIRSAIGAKSQKRLERVPIGPGAASAMPILLLCRAFVTASRIARQGGPGAYDDAG